MDDTCISCGRGTGPGTVLFRAQAGRDLQTGVEGFLCQACQPGSATIIADQSVPLSGRYVMIDFPGGGPIGMG